MFNSNLIERLHYLAPYLQFIEMSTAVLLKLHTRDCTGLDRTISASTELLITRGESLMKWTASGGTWAGTVVYTKYCSREGTTKTWLIGVEL